MNKDTQPLPETFIFRGPHSGAQRIWHWGSSLAIIALLCTVLVASTLLKPRNNVHKIQDKLQEKGLTVTADQAKAVARSIGHPIWVWHKYIGVGLAVLFLFRIILEFFEPAGQSLRARISKGALYLRQMPGDKNVKHYLFVKYFYVLFYAMIFVMVSTGLCLIYADDVEFIHNIEENLKDIHSAVMYGVMGFIVLHIAGLLNAELGAEPGITADMVNGNKK